jgi:pantoate--beta-alanine ligase
MIILKKSNDLQQYLNNARLKKIKIGFVPTMGALHDGHISLIHASKKENGITVCSIFVNPAQFNDKKDFEKYPTTIESDIYKLEKNGCNFVFIPSFEEIYPQGIDLQKRYDLGYLETMLEGKFRPGHFQGVCQVVEKLLCIVQPDEIYLGQKDYQQCMVIKKLIALLTLEKLMHVNVCPVVREKDGLAMSSRNLRLNNEERKRATGIFETLLYLKQHISKNSIEELKQQAASMLSQKGFKTDYIEIADAEKLHPISEWKSAKKTIALIAAFLNDVRLIDNMILTE